MIFVAILEESQKVDLEEKGILKDCRPIVKPALITPEGGFVYLNQGHIDCLLDYESKKVVEETLERLSKGPFENVASNLLISFKGGKKDGNT